MRARRFLLTAAALLCGFILLPVLPFLFAFLVWNEFDEDEYGGDSE